MNKFETYLLNFLLRRVIRQGYPDRFYSFVEAVFSYLEKKYPEDNISTISSYFCEAIEKVKDETF